MALNPEILLGDWDDVFDIVATLRNHLPPNLESLKIYFAPPGLALTVDRREITDQDLNIVHYLLDPKYRHAWAKLTKLTLSFERALDYPPVWYNHAAQSGINLDIRAPYKSDGSYDFEGSDDLSQVELNLY